MTEAPVLRFPISGQEQGSFLLEVSANGSRPLDLKLIGSESTAVFLVKVRHKRIEEYKGSPSHCTDEEWEQILVSTFVDQKPMPDIEVRADVQVDGKADGAAVTLTFRKNIQGITQRLGSITLLENDKTEISPFDWCVTAIMSRNRVIGELADASAKIKTLENSIEELKIQLDDFIITKEEDETQMLEKFRDLLNAKKLKIRQQHRLLAAAKVDPKKLANMGGGDEGDTHRNAGPSRSGKRKNQIKEEDEEDDGFEKMDIDEPDGGDDASTNSQGELDPDAEQDQQLSTENDATASDPETDDEPPAVAEVKGKGVSPPGRVTKSKALVSKEKKPAASKTSAPSRRTRAATQKQPTPMDDSEDEDDAPPPPRTLPFTKTMKAAPVPESANDDETPSDDDDSEL